MQFDFRTLPPADRYKLLIGAVVPRPIALVTTVDREGIVNAAPFSFFNVLSHDPAVVTLGVEQRHSGAPKDTVRNMRETAEFVVNLVDEAIAEAMNICAIDFPEGTDELAEAGLAAAPSAVVAPPRVAQSPVSLECRLLQELRLGGGGKRSIILGEVVYCHVRDGLVDERCRIETAKMKLVGRLAGSGYIRLSDPFSMPRIAYADWRARKAGA
ncbi:MAG TPA: flavin reductase family protein [Stellaceae bacterium]|nr:flavin reductase family protein [Stellaceae bacterium]